MQTTWGWPHSRRRVEAAPPLRCPAGRAGRGRAGRGRVLPGGRTPDALAPWGQALAFIRHVERRWDPSPQRLLDHGNRVAAIPRYTTQCFFMLHREGRHFTRQLDKILTRSVSKLASGGPRRARDPVCPNHPQVSLDRLLGTTRRLPHTQGIERLELRLREHQCGGIQSL